MAVWRTSKSFAPLVIRSITCSTVASVPAYPRGIVFS